MNKQAVTPAMVLEQKLDPKNIKVVLMALELRLMQAVDELATLTINHERTNFVLHMQGRIAELRDWIVPIRRALDALQEAK